MSRRRRSLAPSTRLPRVGKHGPPSSTARTLSKRSKHAKRTLVSGAKRTLVSGAKRTLGKRPNRTSSTKRSQHTSTVRSQRTSTKRPQRRKPPALRGNLHGGEPCQQSIARKLAHFVPPDVLTPKQYKELALLLHPDKNGPCADQATKAFQSVREYYENKKSGFRDIWPHVLRCDGELTPGNLREPEARQADQPRQADQARPAWQEESAERSAERAAWLKQEQFRAWSAKQESRAGRPRPTLSGADAREVARIREQFRAYDHATQPLMRRLMDLMTRRPAERRTFEEQRQVERLQERLRQMEFMRLKALVMEKYLYPVTKIFQDLAAVQHVQTQTYAFPLSPNDFKKVSALATAEYVPLPRQEFYSAVISGASPNLSKTHYTLEKTNVDKVRYYRSRTADLPDLTARHDAESDTWVITL